MAAAAAAPAAAARRVYDGEPLFARGFGAVALHRAPAVDRDDFDFPQSIAEFAFPVGVRLSDRPLPSSYHTFVLTEMSGDRVYGYCMTFSLRVPDHLLGVIKQVLGLQLWQAGGGADGDGDDKPLPAKIYTQRALVLLSRLSDWKGFEELMPLLVGKFAPLEASVDDVGRVLDAHDNGSVFVPSVRVQLDLAQTNVQFSLRPILRTLSPRNLLRLVNAAMNQVSIVFLSTDVALLAPVAEALVALLSPFEWPFAFIPLLPRSLVGVFDAPMPYIVGVHPSAIGDEGVPAESCLVNLDNDSMICPSDNLVPFPARKELKLFNGILKYGNLFAHHHPGAVILRPDRIAAMTQPSGRSRGHRRQLTVRTLDALYDSSSSDDSSSGSDTASKLRGTPANSRAFGESAETRMLLKDLDSRFRTLREALARRGKTDSVFASLKSQIPTEVLSTQQWHLFEIDFASHAPRKQAVSDQFDFLWESVKSAVRCAYRFDRPSSEDGRGAGPPAPPRKTSEDVVYNMMWRSTRSAYHSEPPMQTAQLKRCFRKCFLSLVRAYRAYVTYDASADVGHEMRFDAKGFLAEIADDCLPFVEMLVKTQTFSSFLQSRFAATFEEDIDVYIRRQNEKHLKRIGLYALRTPSSLLYKQTSIMRTWKKRPFLLEGLHINEDKGAHQTLKMQLKPGLTRVSVPDETIRGLPTAFPFEVVTGDVSMMLCAESGTDRREWIRAIQSRTREHMPASLQADDRLRNAIRLLRQQKRREVARVEAEFTQQALVTRRPSTTLSPLPKLPLSPGASPKLGSAAAPDAAPSDLAGAP